MSVNYFYSFYLTVGCICLFVLWDNFRKSSVFFHIIIQYTFYKVNSTPEPIRIEHLLRFYPELSLKKYFKHERLSLTTVLNTENWIRQLKIRRVVDELQGAWKCMPIKTRYLSNVMVMSSLVSTWWIINELRLCDFYFLLCYYQ